MHLMNLLIALSIILLTSGCVAEIVEVENDPCYGDTLDTSLILYGGSDVDLTLDVPECGRHIVVLDFKAIAPYEFRVFDAYHGDIEDFEISVSSSLDSSYEYMEEYETTFLVVTEDDPHYALAQRVTVDNLSNTDQKIRFQVQLD